MIGYGDVTEVKSGPGLYKADHSTLLAVAGRSPEKARDWAMRHGVPRAYASPEELLADPDIDIVYIATPPSTHRDYCLLAARAGKQVCVEKPMALHASECREIADVCAAAGVRLYVAFYRRAMPRFLKLKEWIDAGAIGRVRSVRVVQYQPPAAGDCGNPPPWRLQQAVAGGGKFLDMGVHELDMFDFLFGPIEEAHGIAANLGGYYAVEDTVSAVWRHAGGVLGSGAWCYVCGQGEDRVEIAGSEGRIEFEFFSDKPLALITGDGRQEADIPNPAHVHQPFFQSIVDELNGKGPSPASLEGAIRTSGVADALLRSWRDGQP